MRQFSTLFLLSMHLLLVGMMSCLYGCSPNNRCLSLNGSWTDREGQEIIFQDSGKAFWLTHFGSVTDTIWFAYNLHCNTDPAGLDLSEFSSGPHSGKILYGIIEWLSDTTFRFRYEAGIGTEARPREFDNQQTVKFVKKQ